MKKPSEETGCAAACVASGVPHMPAQAAGLDGLFRLGHSVAIRQYRYLWLVVPLLFVQKENPTELAVGLNRIATGMERVSC